MKNKANPILLLIGLITIIYVVIVGPYLLNGTAFLLGYDMSRQYISFFEELRTQLHSGGLPFWSWVELLGNNYYASKLFYYHDIFDYPFAFTNLSYPTIAMIQTYLRFLVAGIGFYCYSAYHKYSTKTAILGSLIFTFSSYNLSIMMHPLHASFFVFLPLYFLSIDKAMLEKKNNFFIFMVFFLFVTNYYAFYSLSIFTILYCLYKYYTHHLQENLAKLTIRMLKYYFIGALLSGVVTLPEILFILQNPRLGQRSSLFFYDSIRPYLDYLCALFIPSSVLANRADNLSNFIFSYTTANESVITPYLWSTSLTALLFPQLVIKSNKDRKANIITIVIISLFALVPILSSFMHGFSEPSLRWLAMPNFLLSALMLPYIENTSLIDKKILSITAVITLVAMSISLPLIAYIQKVPLDIFGNEKYLIIVYLVTLSCIFFTLLRNNKKMMNVFIFIEIVITSYLSYFGNPFFKQYTVEQIDRLTSVLWYKGAVNDYVCDQDNDTYNHFYRVYVDEEDIYWNTSLNYNLNYDIMGLMTYDTTAHPSSNELKSLVSSGVESFLPWAYDINNPKLMGLLSVKYAIVMDESDIPFDNYSYVGDFQYIPVYQNDDYYNLGKTYTKISKNSSDFIDSVVPDDETINQYLGNEEVAFDTVNKSQNYIYANITTAQKGFAVISIPYDKGWKITINHEPTKFYNVNGGLIGITLHSGYQELEMYYQPPGLKVGLVLSLVGIALLIVNMKKRYD